MKNKYDDLKKSMSKAMVFRWRFIMIASLTLLLTSFEALCQNDLMTIEGTVSSSVENEPIVGATILIKGTSKGTITDVDGHFSLEASSDDVLVISFIGYLKEEIQVGSQTSFQVLLSEDIAKLSEVVVIGYGTQKKKLVTGANISVEGEDLQKMNTIDAVSALQGQSPGVSITQKSGQPGEGYKVVIRGLGTVGNNDPLYVIDGVIGGDINTINPTDIESIDILKDAASAAIYGARAANGVILVTTKKGKKGTVQVSYDGFYGFQNVYKMPALLNAREYMIMMDETEFNDNADGYDWANIVPNYDQIMSGESDGTNWLEEIRVKDAPTQNHSVNILGGSDLSTYSFGVTYASQKGILGKPVEPNYERITGRMNSDHILFQKDGIDFITFGENLSYSYSTRNGIQIGNIYANDIHSMLVAAPIIPMYNEDGEYFNGADMAASGLASYGPQMYNPVALMEYRSGYNLTKTHNLRGNGYLVVQPVKDLKIRSSFGFKMNAESYRQFRPTFELASAGDGFNPTNDRTQQRMRISTGWIWDNTINYVFNPSVDHSIDVLVGQSLEKFNVGEEMDVTNSRSVFSDFDHAYLFNTKGYTAGVTSINGHNLENPWLGALASFFGRINYNYKEKYMLTMIMRADGSSNFAEGHRWGYFPSVAAGWVISNESFMQSVTNFADFVKIRGSWGQNGNCNIDPFQYLATIDFPEVTKYSFGNVKGEQVQGAYQDIIANPDLTWETSEQIDVGLDATFMNSRLGLAFDWYKKTTKDWLVVAPIMATAGTGAPFINGGDVENTGVEVNLSWSDRIGDLNYNVSVNGAYNKNTVLRIANAEGIIHGEEDVLSQGTTEMYRAVVGQPLGVFWGYKTEGIFQNNNEILQRRESGLGVLDGAIPGDVIFADTNKDGVINEDDKTYLGDGNPDMIMGFNFFVEYKGFDFSVNTSAAFGQQIAKSYRSFADSELQNYTTEIFGRWHGEGTSNKLPRLTSGTNNNWQFISDIYIEDGDYLKINNITLGYDFKNLLTNIKFLNQARMYFSVKNLYTFTSYSGMDPEIGYGFEDEDGDANSWVSGIDLGYYPSPRTFLVGFNLKF